MGLIIIVVVVANIYQAFIIYPLFLQAFYILLPHTELPRSHCLHFANDETELQGE